MSLNLVFVLAASLLAAIAAALLLWSIFYDRARGRIRCPRCWYNLAQSVPDAAGLHTCSECGKASLTDRALRRTRRRWKPAILAILLLLAAPIVAQIPQIQSRGWMSIIPDRVIFVTLPIGGYDGPIGLELQRRFGLKPWPGNKFAATLSTEDRRVLLRRAISGTIFARPISSAWRDSYGKVIRQGWMLLVDFNELQKPGPLAQELEALKNLPYEFNARTRDRWPKDTPPDVEFKVEHWWPPNITDNISGIDWATPAGSSGHSRGGRGHFSLPIHDTGNVTVNMQIDLEQQQFGKPGTKRLLARESRSVSYTTVDSVDDVITPVLSEEIDAALRKNFQFTHRPGSSVSPDTSSLIIPNSDDVAFAFLMELSHNGRPIMTAHVRWLGSTPSGWTFGNANIPGDRKETDRYISENVDKPGWTVHITTDPAWALALFDAKRYWKGDLTFPTTVTATRPGFVTPPLPPAK